jgi:hypothetical protein
MAGTLSNIRVEPCQVLWDETDLGFTEGDISVELTEDAVDIVAHQEGTNVMDGIITGHGVEVALTIKETSATQIATLLKAGGAAASANTEVSTVTLVADVAGSLNDKYFFLSTGGSATHTHYVWYNINSAGTDPAISGMTGVEIAGATGASAATLAGATNTAIDALAGYSSTVSDATVTITNAASGGAHDIADGPTGSSTGFTFDVTTQGQAAISGWGKAKDFSAMSSYAKKLRLHPVTQSATTHTRDLTFWKAYPIPGSITYSGENPLMVEVTFRIFPDTERRDQVRLFGYGEGA